MAFEDRMVYITGLVVKEVEEKTLSEIVEDIPLPPSSLILADRRFDHAHLLNNWMHETPDPVLEF